MPKRNAIERAEELASLLALRGKGTSQLNRKAIRAATSHPAIRK
jgi:hypothetical protein